jgi:hypothetical protein
VAEHLAPSGVAGKAEDAWVACLVHPDLEAIGSCAGCGAPLCEDCFYRFGQPWCASCVLAWAARRRMEFGAHSWFYGSPVAAVSQTGTFDPHLLGGVALGAYVAACLPAGWRAFRPVRGLAWRIAMTMLLGWFAGPICILWMGARLREVRQLEALARAG